MFYTVFFHWMYKMKFSCYQESSEKSFQQGFEAAPYKGITNGINVKRKLRDRHFLGIVRVTELIHF